eukprot:51397-Eustigmatos_ZCMA.PRE.1
MEKKDNRHMTLSSDAITTLRSSSSVRMSDVRRHWDANASKSRHPSGAVGKLSAVRCFSCSMSRSGTHPASGCKYL